MDDKRYNIFSIIGTLELLASFFLMILATAYPTTILYTQQSALFIISSLFGLGGVVTIWLLIISAPDNK